MPTINGDARLRDLNAAFIGDYNPEKKSHHYVETFEAAQGVMFQCPKCAQGKPVAEETDLITGKIKRYVMGAHYIICWFKRPKQARPVPDDAEPKPGRWIPWGDSIENLTLTPSINLSSTRGCQWHGFVRDGIATLV